MKRTVILAAFGYAAACLFCVGVGCWLRAISAPKWLQMDTTQRPAVLRPWAVEADCYSQLARVQRILHGDGLIQNHFKVENWPQGLVPSTTAPFDYCILLLYAPLKLLTKFPLDWAGALVSPLLWVALALFWMVFRSREFNRTGRLLLILGSAIIPAIVLATECGRPRHQSLILALMALGFTAEYERWQPSLLPKRGWDILAGLVWGVACWTSLFEPLFVVAALVLFNWIARKRERPVFLVSFGFTMLAALLVEGIHIYIPPPEYHAALVNWLNTIAEVRGMPFAALAQRMTLILVLLPVIAWRLWLKKNGTLTDRLLILLTAALTLFAMMQSRWIYYAALCELFLIARYCQSAPLRWSRIIVLVVFAAGLGDAVYTAIQWESQATEDQPSGQLAELARSIDQPGGIMAPWWLSPGLLYFSGQPIVSGSSHCGISGIVDSALFFATTSWVDADRILQQRQVRWVVVYDNPDYVYPVLNTAHGILGLPMYTDDTKGAAAANLTVAQILINDHLVPTAYRLRAVTPQLKLYEYLPDSGQP